MADPSLQDLPEVALTAWLSFRDELRRILGDDLVAMWAHGGTISTGDPPHAADLDTYVVIARELDDAAAREIEVAQDAIARTNEIEWDAWYVLADDVRRADPPRHAWREERRDTSWAIHRAHWLAGRVVTLHGPDPADVVPAPTREELEGELNRELEHIERHVAEGDTDPFEATYAILNGSRILHAVETGNIAISKRAAGAWALEHLPARWQPALQAALRSYDSEATDDDASRIAAEMAPFVAFVRELLPFGDELRPDGGQRAPSAMPGMSNPK